MTRAPSSPEKPRVGITLGDPAGIGPEVVLKAVALPEVRSICSPILIGSASVLREQADELSLPADFPVFVDWNSAVTASDLPLILDTGVPRDSIRWGTLSPASGQAAIAAIERCAELCLAGELDAMATAPINKESLRLAGSPFPGHTEMLTALCNASESLMCFFAGELKVFLLSIHCSLADAIKSITQQRVISAIRLAHRELRRFGLDHPRIAVAGLNPHAGEHGMFGTEEEREITPAINTCRSEYEIDVTGPLAADTLFLRAWRGEFDAVAACYHDQGLIAVKCLAFGDAVNVTLGLPIIRTSVDHGTAFDIAGRGVADAHAMVEAIKLAAKLSRLASS